MSKVKLGDVAREYKETCKGSKDGFPIVGLEHLIPEEITLTMWDEETENTFTKMFRKGQVLFGRRRAYLKKAAVAPFDGVCSGDITVIEAIYDKILPELLPFVIQNDSLFNFAVGKSAGSLSPRVKWEHLKEYELNLPDIAEQKRLAELLWAANDTKEAYKKLLSLTDDLVKAKFIEMFGDLHQNTLNWEIAPVEKWVKDKFIERPMDGNHGDKHPKASDYVSSGVPFIMANNLTDGKIDYYSCNYITEKQANSLDKGFSKAGDVLITHKGTIGRTAIVDDEFDFIMLTPQVTYYRIIKGLNNKYLKAYFDSDYFQTEIFKIAGSGTTRAYIGITAQNKLPIIVPPMELQNQFVDFIQQVDKSKLELQQTILGLENTVKSLIKQYIG